MNTWHPPHARIEARRVPNEAQPIVLPNHWITTYVVDDGARLQPSLLGASVDNAHGYLDWPSPGDNLSHI